MDDEPTDDQETVTSWTNPYTAEYKRRYAMVMAMRPFEISSRSEPDVARLQRERPGATEPHLAIRRGNSQPFNPDVGDPFVMELSRLLANTLASAKSLISGQRARACR